MRSRAHFLILIGLAFIMLAVTAPVAFAQAAPPISAAPATAPAKSADPFRLNIGLEGSGQPGQVSVAVQIVIVMTLLSVAPSIILLMTSFTRIVIVLGFVRTALGTPSAPSQPDHRRALAVSHFLPDGTGL